MFSHHVPPSKNRHPYHCAPVEPMLQDNPKLIGQDKWNLVGNHLHELRDKESTHNHGLKTKWELSLTINETLTLSPP